MKINMKLNENDGFDGFLLDSKDINRLEFALNRILKKKYDWINSIKLKMVAQDREYQNYYLFFGGMISVDENWAKRIWEKTRVTDFPGNEEHDYENYEALESFLKELLIFEDTISLLHIMKIKILFDRIYITKRQVFISRITTLNNLLKYL